MHGSLRVQRDQYDDISPEFSSCRAFVGDGDAEARADADADGCRQHMLWRTEGYKKHFRADTEIDVNSPRCRRDDYSAWSSSMRLW